MNSSIERAPAAQRAQEPDVESNLPRLAVVGDVSVEFTTGGALILHRLLRGYPVDRLRVVENPAFARGDPKLRLPDVHYEGVTYRVSRFVRNRFNPAWPVAMSLWIRRRTRIVLDVLRDFGPQAILTVPHGYLWFAAADAARRLRIPLHLIIHDDWASLQTHNRAGRVYDAARWGSRRVMGRVYRQASSRFCVSPGMNERYQEWFGARGSVLYPNRGEDSVTPRVRVRCAAPERPVAAFCGWIHQDGVANALRQIGNSLHSIGGRLDLYGGLSPDRLEVFRLLPPAICSVGFLPMAEMVDRISATAHALLLPSSFFAREQFDVATLFPSKLADYTAMGIPIVVWGPRYSSAARWAAENPGAAVLVTSPCVDDALAAIVKLASNRSYAASIAAEGVRVGNSQFDLRNARRMLFDAISQTRGHPDAAGPEIRARPRM